MKFLYTMTVGVLLGCFFLVMPEVADAQTRLVPCGSVDQAPCTLCHFIELAVNIANFILQILFITALTVLVAAGIIYIVSAGNQQMIQMAKLAIKGALVGVAIALVGWVVITWIFIKMTVGGSVSTTLIYTQAANTWNFSCDTTAQ